MFSYLDSDIPLTGNACSDAAVTAQIATGQPDVSNEHTQIPGVQLIPVLTDSLAQDCSPEATEKVEKVNKVEKCVHNDVQVATISSVASPSCPRLLEIPVALANNNQHVVSALIDSGATHSFIKADLIGLVNFSCTEVDPLHITLADLTQVISTYSVALPLTFTDIYSQQFKIVCTLRVVENLSSDVILGMDWLTGCNPSIDWVGLRLSLQHAGQCRCVQGIPVQSTVNVDLCSMKGILHTMRANKTNAWFALIRSSPTDQGERPLNQDIDQLCIEYKDIFQEPGYPPERPFEHRIDLNDELAKPPKPRQYRMSQAEQAEVQKQITQLLEKGWIKPSVSPYGAPILFVRKKTGELRMCIDFRMLNSNTKLDVFPIPRIADMLDKLSRARIFSSIDLASAYHQVRIAPEHTHRTAFLTSFGLFEYVVLPFGLCNAPATFQRIMNSTFADVLGLFVMIYLDDILVFSENEQQHLEHLRQVFEILRQNQFYAKRKKCEFGKKEIQYLGHLVSGGKVTVDPLKSEPVRTWPTPTCTKDIQQFLGLANYYAEYIPNFAQVAAPLSDLLAKQGTWIWGDIQQDAFDTLKQRLCSSPVLRLPDFERNFIVECDASDVHTGAVLLQEYEDGFHPVAYFSKKLLPAERNYATHDRELLAIFRACMKWRCYLDCKPTVIYTDHEPLTKVFSQPYLSRRQTRWLERLGELSIDIRYKPGKLMIVPDTLSRLPVSQQQFLSDEDCSRVLPWLKQVAPHCKLGDCCNAAVEALAAGCQLQLLRCAHCSAAHLDTGKFATKLHTLHTCNSCGKTWQHQGTQVQGNPLAEWHPVVRGQQLVLTADPRGQARASSLVVEPAWLGQVYQGQQDPQDAEMVRLLQSARSSNAQFVVRTVHGFELVYRVAKDGVLQLVIPKQYGLRQQLLEELHCSTYASHLGARKTSSALLARVFWPKLDADVRRFVKGCKVCQRVKDVNQLPQGLLQPLPIPSGRFVCWSMDFITDLPEITGFNGIFTVVDKFSKFTRLVPVRVGEGQLSAPEVARLFFENVVVLFGVPQQVLHDRDPRFTSQFWQALWKIMGSKVLFSSAHHPQTDGQTERQHRTIEQLIRSHVVSGGKSWLEALPFVELCLNTSVQDSTRVTPAKLVFGVDVALPVDRLDGLHPVEAAQDLVTGWKELLEVTRQRLKLAQESQKRFADTRRRDVTFAVGDKVWLATKNLRLKGIPRKLAPRYVGPFNVLKRIGQAAYRLDLNGSGLQGIHDVFHVSLLRTCEDNGLDQPVAPVEIDGDLEWEVDRILGHRRRGSAIQYLVSFVGFDISENQWLSEDDLQNASILLGEYKRAHSL